MTKYVGDLVYPSEKYLHNGEEKTRWLNCGGVFESDDGKISVKITAMPTLMESGNWFRVFEPKPKDFQTKAAKTSQPAPQQGGFDDDDIPF